MNYIHDATFLMMIFILPSLFGLTLIGEGVAKVMNYDNHGWIGVAAGAAFIVVIVMAFFLLSTNVLNQ